MLKGRRARQLVADTPVELTVEISGLVEVAGVVVDFDLSAPFCRLVIHCTAAHTAGSGLGPDSSHCWQVMILFSGGSTEVIVLAGCCWMFGGIEIVTL